MKKIAILGNNDAITGFKALGIESFAIQNKDQAIETLESIKKNENFGIVLVTEDWHEQIDTEISELFEGMALPAFLAIPTAQGSSGSGLKNIKKIVEQAIGSDILS